MNDTLRSRASRYRRASASGLLILVLGYLVFISGRQALSDFYTLLAQQEFQQGAGTPKKDQDGSWQRSLGYLTEARRHSPDNAWPMGVTGDLRIRRMRTSTDRKQAFGEAFSVQFDLRAYLRQNPTSPLAWANLALAKFYTGDTGAEFIKALSLAQELGPWEPNPQSIVIAVGLSLWPQLGAAEQAQLLGTLERAARRNIETVAKIAIATKRLDLFCGLSYVQNSATKACIKNDSK